jgi:phosphomevalonate kinase
MITTEAPGKLFLAGEFAVTQPNQPAIIIAVDKYVTVSVLAQENASFITVQSDLLGHTSFDLQTLEQDNNSLEWGLIHQTLKLFSDLIAEHGRKLSGLEVVISSDLSQDGLKMGLGSSGALTVALLDALLQTFSIPFTKDQLYKLAAMVLLQTPGFEKGSMGDLAAAVYGGVISYERFDVFTVKAWLADNRFISEIIAATWPGLVLAPLEWSNDWFIRFGWTKSPVSTQNVIKQLNFTNETAFLEQSKTVVYEISKAFTTHNYLALADGLTKNQALLLTFAERNNLDYLTPALSQLLLDAQETRAVAKISGAGGGDMGFAISRSSDALEQVEKTWRSHNISPVSLNIAPAND